jgi:hypothetical protein
VASVSITVGSRDSRDTVWVVADIAATRWRNLGGRTCDTFRSAPSAAPSVRTKAANRRPTTVATVSSSVSTRGGIARPATSR